MAYSDFDLEKVTTDFNLTQVHDRDLFADIVPIAPSDYLRDWLAEFAPVAIGFQSERGRSEMITLPILAEAKRRTDHFGSIAVSVPFDVDESRGLHGVCDFLITRTRDVFYLRTPVFAAVEGKPGSLSDRLGECAAELVAINLFSEKHHRRLPTAYGCVTSGNVWRFLKLEGRELTIDKHERYSSELPTILGILVSIAGTAPPV